MQQHLKLSCTYVWHCIGHSGQCRTDIAKILSQISLGSVCQWAFAEAGLIRKRDLTNAASDRQQSHAQMGVGQASAEKQGRRSYQAHLTALLEAL